MTYLLERHLILGLAIAAIFFMASTLPGVVALAQGIKIEGVVCHSEYGSSQGSDVPRHKPLPEYCQLCPAGCVKIAAIDHYHEAVAAFPEEAGWQPPDYRASLIVRRIELSPLHGRAPPLES